MVEVLVAAFRSYNVSLTVRTGVDVELFAFTLAGAVGAGPTTVMKSVAPCCSLMTRCGSECAASPPRVSTQNRARFQGVRSSGIFKGPGWPVFPEACHIPPSFNPASWHRFALLAASLRAAPLRFAHIAEVGKIGAAGRYALLGLGLSRP